MTMRWTLWIKILSTVDIVQVILLFSAFSISVLRISLELYEFTYRKYFKLAQILFFIHEYHQASQNDATIIETFLTDFLDTNSFSVCITSHFFRFNAKLSIFFWGLTLRSSLQPKRDLQRNSSHIIVRIPREVGGWSVFIV